MSDVFVKKSFDYPVGKVDCYYDKSSGAFGSTVETPINCVFVPDKDYPSFNSTTSVSWSGSILDTSFYASNVIPTWFYIFVFLIFLYYFGKIIYVITVKFFEFVIDFLKPNK